MSLTQNAECQKYNGKIRSQFSHTPPLVNTYLNHSFSDQQFYKQALDCYLYRKVFLRSEEMKAQGGHGLNPIELYTSTVGQTARRCTAAACVVTITDSLILNTELGKRTEQRDVFLLTLTPPFLTTILCLSTLSHRLTACFHCQKPR